MTVDQASCSKGYVSSNNSNTNAFNNSSNIHPENPNCNYTSGFNGTSSAAPNVSGVVALMLEANPNLTWRDVKHILASTSQQIAPSTSYEFPPGTGIYQYRWVTNSANYTHHNWYGFGNVDASAAVTAAANYNAGQLGTFVDTGTVSSGAIFKTLSDWALHSDSLSVTAPSGSSDFVEFIKIRIYLNHAAPVGIGLRLVSPAGTEIPIHTPYTLGQVNPYNSLGPSSGYIPFDIGVSGFYGEGMTGTWELKIDDLREDGIGGELAQWEIKIYGH
jgi:subtilisin-like proprotein convertase family protein